MHSRMISIVRNLCKRLGLVSVILLTLAVVMPTTQAQACEPIREGSSLSAVITGSYGCTIEDCRDCGIACSHGCCHATSVGLPAMTPAPRVVVTAIALKGWLQMAGEPGSAGPGVERPPRA